MRRLFLALLALVAVALLALGALSAARRALDPFTTYDPVAAARERAALDALAREAELAEQLAPVDLAVAAGWRLLPLLAALGALGYLAAVGVAALARFRRLARPDERGLLPVELAALERYAAPALAGYHAAQLAAAQRPNTPHSYAPSISYAPHSAPRLDYRHHGAEGYGPALLPADTAAAGDVPSFAQLLDRGEIGPGRPMLLGYDDSGEPLAGSWLDLYSCAVGGLSGSGKSWTAVFLACQAALYGSRVVLLDPHAGNAESLAQRLAPMRARFVCDVAESPAEMLRAVELVADELARRKRPGAPRAEGWIFIADEFSALQRGQLAEPLAQLVEALGQEGRKLGLYAMVAGQVWSAARAGGTELRDSLASAYVHRLRPAQARMLTGLTADDLPDDLLELPPGCAYLLNTAGDLRRVTIPHMAPADVARVAGLLSDDAPRLDLGHGRAAGRAAPGPRGPLVTPPWPGPGLDNGPGRASASGRAEPLPAEAAALLARFAAGATVHDLASERAGTPNPGDRRYKLARQQVEAALREATARALGLAEGARP